MVYGWQTVTDKQARFRTKLKKDQIQDLHKFMYRKFQFDMHHINGSRGSKMCFVQISLNPAREICVTVK